MTELVLGLALLPLTALLVRAERERRRLRAEAAIAARVAERAQSETGLRPTLRAVADELMAPFAADRALLAVREAGSGPAHLWAFARASPGESPTVAVSELHAEELGGYLLGPGVGALCLRAGGPADVAAALQAAHPFRCALTVSFGAEGEWLGRLWVLDPAARRCSPAGLRLLQRLVYQASPALHVARIRRLLHSQVTAAERARVSRELHDGVIQSLTSLVFQLDVLRRRHDQGPATPEELAALQHQLRNEVLSVRELIQQMRPLDVGPGELLEFLANHVSRFGRDTGIAATFVSNLTEVPIPARQCAELARIVQEALVNVRKHSRARHVVVRLARDDGHCRVVIDDDGCGFSFSGRLDQAALDASRRGPVVIKERVRAIGGALSIDSHPERGARLEITLPTDG